MRRLVLLALGLTAGLSLSAAVRTWKGGGSTLRWSDGSNWVGGVAPAAGDIAQIPAGKTAWASHHTDVNGGDLTLVNSLASIDLVAEDSVFEMDSENDDALKTGTYDFTTPMTGIGVCKFSNGVNNDRHVALKADNSAFQGSFLFYRLQAWICHIHALGTTNLVRWSPLQGNHGLHFNVPGTYENPIDAIHTANIYPDIGGNCGKPVILAGKLTNVNGGTICPHGNGGYTTFTGGIDNGSYNRQQCRFKSGAHIAGAGITGTTRVYSGQSIYLGALVNGTFLGAGGLTTCEAANVLKGFIIYTSDPGGGTLDLNGYDQAPTSFDFGSLTEAKGPTTVVTSSVPAKLSISGLASASTWYTFWGRIQGMASVEFTGANNNAKIPFGGTNNTKGELTITNKGIYEFLSTCSFSNVKRIAILNGTSKYSTTKLLFHTAAINPGKFKLELNGAYAFADIDENIQVDVKWAKVNGAFLPAGVYGSQAAVDAGYAETVCANLTGLGTLKVRQQGPMGIVLSIR